jgi:hypothetical protein
VCDVTLSACVPEKSTVDARGAEAQRGCYGRVAVAGCLLFHGGLLRDRKLETAPIVADAHQRSDAQDAQDSLSESHAGECLLNWTLRHGKSRHSLHASSARVFAI